MTILELVEEAQNEDIVKVYVGEFDSFQHECFI